MTEWLSHLLGTGGLALLLPTVVLLASLRWGWAAFASDYPPDIQALLPEPTTREARAGQILGGAFFVSLLAALLVTTASWEPARDRFISAWLTALGAVVLFCLIDLVVVDWLVVCTWRPDWVVPRGTEDAEGWNDYAFHLRVQLEPKGLAVLAVMPLPFAAVTRFLL